VFHHSVALPRGHLVPQTASTPPDVATHLRSGAGSPRERRSHGGAPELPVFSRPCRQTESTRSVSPSQGRTLGNSAVRPGRLSAALSGDHSATKLDKTHLRSYSIRLRGT